MTHCYNVCILFFLFQGHQLAYWLGPFDKSFSLSFREVLLLVLYCGFFTWIIFLLLRLVYKEGIESITS